MRKILLLAAVLALAACSAVKPAAKTETVPQDIPPTEKSIAIYRLPQGEWVIRNGPRAETPFLPASTFKIPHTLIALQSGAVEPDEVFEWDGRDRGFEPWNRDLTLEQAFRWSAIWVYQKIARRIGPERMRNYVELIGYGNADIGGAIDSFWLDGDLRITSRQQIDFLRRLHANKLPFNREHMDFVRQIMVRDSGRGWLMRAKSGWAQRIAPQHGWMVGWIEKGPETTFFATNVEITERAHAKLRMVYTKSVLREIGAIGPEQE